MKIVFITNCTFPYGSASSIRTLNIAHLLHCVGHDVHIIADYTSKESGQFDFCDFETVTEFTTSHIKRLTVPRKCINALELYCNNNVVDAVLTNACSDRFMKIAHFCKSKNIKLYVESCEWYHYSNYKFGKMDYRYWINEKMISKGFKAADGFISISRFLDEHNSALGIPSIRIPTIMDVDNTRFSIEQEDKKDDKIHLIYTGNPGKSKEYLAPVVDCLAHNDIFKKKIRFHIFGPSLEQVKYNLNRSVENLELAEDSVVIHGSVPQKEMNDIMRKAHYSIFLRPDRISSKAGFPTKLGESMAAGTPVICNDTGDIGLYLSDGINGFIVEGYEEDDMYKLFERILSITSEEYLCLRSEARKTAVNNFDYKNYINEIKKVFS